MNGIKILLVQPDQPEYVYPKEYYIPACTMMLGSALKEHNIDTKLIDLNVFKYKKKTDTLAALLSEIEEYKPALVGISIMSSAVFTLCHLYAQKIRERFKDIKIVIGGMHSTLFHKEILKNCDFIDYAVSGPGEISIVKLAEYLAGNISIDKVPSLSYKLNGGIIVNEREEITDLKLLPKLDYDLIEDVTDFYHTGLTEIWHNPKKQIIHASFPIHATRGCPINCNFCAMYQMMGKKWKARPAEDVVDEMEMMYNRYGNAYFSFLDDSLTLNKKNIISICNEVIKRKLDFQLSTPNGVFINSLDREVLDAMHSAGFVRTMIAIESGNEYMRNKIMHKYLKNEKIYEIVDIIKSYKDLYFGVSFIIGMPEETEQSLQDTYDMVVKIDADYPAVHNIMPYPGTCLFDQCIRDNLFLKNVNLSTLWKSNMFHITGNKQFFIKPYNLSIEVLDEFRKKIDNIIDVDKRTNYKLKPRTSICTK